MKFTSKAKLSFSKNLNFLITWTALFWWKICSAVGLFNVHVNGEKPWKIIISDAILKGVSFIAFSLSANVANKVNKYSIERFVL